MENRPYEGNPGRIEPESDVFGQFYELERQKDKERFPDEPEEYSDFRVLKAVLMNPFFGAVNLNMDEIRILTVKLLTDSKTAHHFQEWIRVSELYFDWDMLPERARKIYETGKGILENIRNREK